MKDTKTQNGTINGLKSIRLLCFVAIYLLHSSQTAGVLANLSVLSVSVFVVLSGFVLSYRYKDESIGCSVKDCLKFGFKRIRKLYSLHIVTLIFFLLYLSDTTLNDQGIKEWFSLLSPSLLAQIFLVQSWSLDHDTIMYGNAISWFLSAALFLYILFPLIHQYVKKLNIKKSWIVILACVLSKILTYLLLYPIITKYFDWNLATYFFPPARVGEFISGCCLFNIWSKQKDSCDTKTGTLYELIFVAAIVCFSTLVKSEYYVYYRIIVNILSLMAVFLFANCNGYITKFLTNKITIKLGNYSNYAWLIHNFFVQFLPYAAGFYHIQVPTIVFVIVGISASLYLGYKYARYIDNKTDSPMPKENHIYELDLIRVLCAIGVITFHFVAENNIELSDIDRRTFDRLSIILNGCFFIISGFVLKTKYPKISNLKQYFVSRFKSIYPCFWFTWIVFAIRSRLLNGESFSGYPLFSYLLTFTAFDGFLYERIKSLYIIGEWFLGAIIICYLVYPVIDKFFNKKKLYFIIAIFIVLNILHYECEFKQINIAGLSVITCILEMLFGILLSKHKDLWNNKYGLIISFIISVFLILTNVDSYLSFFMPVHIVSCFVFVYNSAGVFNKNKTYQTVISTLSKYTYCFFLVQHVCVNAAIARYKPTALSEEVLVVSLTIVTSFILSVIIYHSVNKIKQLFFESENRKKNIAILMIIVITGVSGIHLYEYIDERKSIIENLENYTIYESSIDYWVDSIESTGDRITMKGWAYPLDAAINDYQIGIEVYGKIYIADKQHREDVKNVYGLKDADVGFVISLRNNEYYQICIVDEKNKVIYK